MGNKTNYYVVFGKIIKIIDKIYIKAIVVLPRVYALILHLHYLQHTRNISSCVFFQNI